MRQHEPKNCRSCNALIFWAQVLSGDRKSAVKMKDATKPQAMPVNAESFAPEQADPKARVVLFDREGTIVAYVLKEGELPLPGERLRTAHHITCPQAAKWRGQKPGGGRGKKGRFRRGR